MDQGVRKALSYVLLGAGVFCVGTAVLIVARAESHQSSLVRQWTEPDFPPGGDHLILPQGAVARLHFGRQQRDVFVWDDERPDHLAKGPVWLRPSRGFASLGNTVVAGHRDTHFLFLKDARVGDLFDVDQGALHLTFRIAKIQIVTPADRSLLAPTPVKTVTLVTCYPFYAIGRADRRMIVRAELVTE